MRKFSMPVLLLIAVLVTLVPDAHAAQSTQRVQFPIAGDTETNPCTGEQITFTKGVFQVVVRQGSDASGGTHFIAEGNAQGAEGVAADGTRYRASGGFWFEDNATNGASNTTVTEVFNLISQGDGDNFSMQAAFHLGFDANGRLVSLVMNLADGTCRG